MNRCILLLALVIAGFHLPAQPLYRDSAFIREAAFPRADNKLIAARYQVLDYIYLFGIKDVSGVFPADSVYKAYRNFDFEQYHILGRYACAQCFLHCRHEEGVNNACHRNSCRYSWMWMVRSNKKAFDTLSSKAEHTTKDFPGIYDTIVQPQTDTGAGLAHWFTTSIGDCHAQFEYALVTDKYFPVTLLLETSYYGGCRAARYDDMDISFKPRADKKIYRKGELTKDRKKHSQYIN